VYFGQSTLIEYFSPGTVSSFFLDLAVFAGLSTCRCVLLNTIDINLVASLFVVC